MICLVLYLLLANYAAEGYTAGQVSRARAFARPTAHGDVLMTTAVALDALDLAALLCSRVCHDLISPTGAIVNGLEVLDEKESDQQTKDFAFDLIKKSAKAASARLQFCRLAFGAAGSAGAQQGSQRQQPKPPRKAHRAVAPCTPIPPVLSWMHVRSPQLTDSVPRSLGPRIPKSRFVLSYSCSWQTTQPRVIRQDR